MALNAIARYFPGRMSGDILRHTKQIHFINQHLHQMFATFHEEEDFEFYAMNSIFSLSIGGLSFVASETRSFIFYVVDSPI